MHVKNPNEAKYQLLINKQEYSGLKHFNGFKASIKYATDMDHICKNIEEYNPPHPPPIPPPPPPPPHPPPQKSTENNYLNLNLPHEKDGSSFLK